MGGDQEEMGGYYIGEVDEVILRNYHIHMHICVSVIGFSSKDFSSGKILWGPRRSKSRDFWYHGP